MNEIIIIGGSNYNELGLVRSFGENGIRPCAIIIGNRRDIKRASVYYSKYWKHIDIVSNEEDALSLLRLHYSGLGEKPIIITTNDYIMQFFDSFYKELENDFILSSFNQVSDGINQYADKEKQATFAKKIGFHMLETQVLDLQIDGKVESPFTFPVFMKPVKGGEGSKYDISVAFCNSDFIHIVEKLRMKKYRRILVQPYLKNRKEYLITGAVSPRNSLVSFSVLRGIRQWPTTYGISSFSCLVTEKRIVDYASRLLKAVVSAGYDGPIDVEFFETDDGKLYVNEFNWRSSGRNWVALYNGVYSTVWWALHHSGIDVSSKELINDIDGYAMYEFDDIRHCFHHNVQVKNWLTDYFHTGAFSARFFRDPVPMLIETLSFIKRAIKKKL